MYVLYASMRYMCCICFVRATPALPPSATKSDREKKAQKGALCRRCRRLLLSTWCTLFSVSCCCYFDGVGRYHRRRTSGPSLAVGQPRSTPCACCPMSPPSIDRSPLTLSLRTRCSLRTCFSSVCLFGGGTSCQQTRHGRQPCSARITSTSPSGRASSRIGKGFSRCFFVVFNLFVVIPFFLFPFSSLNCVFCFDFCHIFRLIPRLLRMCHFL